MRRGQKARGVLITKTTNCWMSLAVLNHRCIRYIPLAISLLTIQVTVSTKLKPLTREVSSLPDNGRLRLIVNLHLKFCDIRFGIRLGCFRVGTDESGLRESSTSRIVAGN